MSTDVEGKQKYKRHNEQFDLRVKKIKNKLKTEKKKKKSNIHAEAVTVGKI